MPTAVNPPNEVTKDQRSTTQEFLATESKFQAGFYIEAPRFSFLIYSSQYSPYQASQWRPCFAENTQFEFWL